MNISKRAQQLNEKQLGNLKDILEVEKKRLSDGELKERAGIAYGFYKSYFDDVIKLLIYEQLKFIGEKAMPEDLLFSRGTLNGLYIIQEWFNEQRDIAKSPSQEKQSEKDNLETITEE